MIVKVIIKRDVKDGQEMEFFTHLKMFRTKAMDQKGYISGETLVCAEETNRVLVISKWESMEDWEAWKNNPERQVLDDEICKYQENPTIAEAYVFSKFRVAAVHGFPLPLQKQEHLWNA